MTAFANRCLVMGDFTCVCACRWGRGGVQFTNKLRRKEERESIWSFCVCDAVPLTNLEFETAPHPTS